MPWSDRLDTLFRDVRFAWRSIWRSPVFTLTVIGTLALGIGANTAIFSFVSGVLLRPLPYHNDGELMSLQTVLPSFGPEAASVPDFRDWKAQNQTFTSMTAASNAAGNLTAEGSDPERIRYARVLEDFFPTFGVQPAAGRFFSADDNRPGSDRVAVLSDGLWRRRFSGDAAVVGKTITLGSIAFTVIGVAPPGFAYPANAELWAPQAFGPGNPVPPRRADFLRVIGRLKPGVSLTAAQADMALTAQRLEKSYPGSNRGVGIGVQSLRQSLVGDVRPALIMLTVAVGIVLLIACANIANLLLARATGRQREMAVRAALGASRERLAGQVLLESTMLSLLGGAAGLGVAWWGVRLLKATAPASMPLLGEVRINASVLLFAFVMSVLTGLSFGLAPALQAMRLSLRSGLSEGSGASSSGRSERVRRTLVTVQAALALTLLSGAGLFLQSFVRLQHVDLGFNDRGLLSLRVALPQAKYRGPGATAAFFRQLRERVAVLPGVQGVGMSSDIPLGGGFNYLSFDILGRARPGPNEHSPDAIPTSADSAWFATMQIPLLRGRAFGTSDDSIAPPVAVVNEEFARRYFPSGDVLGARVSFGGPDESAGATTIVGVVKTTRLEGVGRASYPQFFRPLTQSPDNAIYLTVRSASGDPAKLAPAIRREVLALDSQQPISDVRTMTERVDESIGQSRLNSTLLSGLSLVALIIAGLGIYGVVAYGVARRTREIGVRMALGASRQDVLSLVLSQGMRPVIFGTVLGLGASAALGRVARTLLYGSDGVDPATFGAATLAFVAVATVACLVPASRASRVAPSVALRSE